VLGILHFSSAKVLRSEMKWEKLIKEEKGI
jgi:hypothetical protein